MSAAPDQKQGEMLHQLLWDGENSLKVQSEIAPDHELAPRDWEGMIAKSHFLNGNIVTGMQNEGCGRVRFDEKADAHGQKRVELSSYKSTRPFSEDPVIGKELKEIQKTPPNALMLHIREASSTTGKTEIKVENGHPFRLKNFAMMHNGTLPPNTVHWLNKKVSAYHQKFPNDIPLPTGSADSERFFLYLMGRLREECGTLDFKKIPTEKIEKVFHQALKRLEFMSSKPENAFEMKMSRFFAPLTGLNVDEKSATRFPFGLTVVLGDGERMFLSRYNRNLRLATMQDEDGKAKAVLVSTGNIQPTPESGLKKLQWWEIPEAHMVTLERNRAAETIDCNLQPFTWPRQTKLNQLLWKVSSWIQLRDNPKETLPKYEPPAEKAQNTEPS